MKFVQTEIHDVKIIVPRVFQDPRGLFFESYQSKEFFANGIKELFVQDNHVRSEKAVLRGLHFQKAPKQQAKLVRVIRGSVFDVAVDIRKSSPTYGRYVAAELSGENGRMMYVPAGFAHGYLSLEEGTEVLYKVSDFYSPEHEGGIAWDDPDLKIPWPKLDVNFVLSKKDQDLPRLRDLGAVL